LARLTLKRLAARLKTPDHHFYDLAESTEYEIAKRDPVHWYLEGHDWDDACRKAIKQAFRFFPEGCRRVFQIRDLIRQAGPASELLLDGAVHVSGPLLGYQRDYERIQARRGKKIPLESQQACRWPRWGPLELDCEAAATAHCCAVGNADGGTEIVLRALMQSVATHRWLVFYGRNDLLPSIVDMRPDDQIHILNPLDAQCSAWDVADDAPSVKQTQEIVAAFLPAVSQQETFLAESARAVLAAVIDALNEKAAGKWNLLHLIAATEPPNLRTLLLGSPATEMVCKTHLADPHAGLVVSFLQSRLQPLKPIAAAWQHAPRKISIAAWLQSSSTLVLASSFRHQHLLAPLNRILFQLLASSLVEPKAFPPQRTWVFLSDLCQIGRLESLSPLLSRGPAAGVTVALSVEDLEILQRHYGPEATGILGLCGNYAFLRIANPATARWASQTLGVAKVQILYQTESTLSGRTSRGVTITPAERPLVPPTAFQQLPLPKDGRGPAGYFRSLGRRAYKGQIDLDRFIANHWLRQPSSETPAFVPRPDEHFQFPQDTAAILADLGLSPARRRRRSGTRQPLPATPEREPDRETSDQDAAAGYEFDPRDFPRLDALSE